MQVGGAEDFQFGNINLLARSVVDAIMSFTGGERVSGEGHTPNRAAKALGAISFPGTLDNI